MPPNHWHIGGYGVLLVQSRAPRPATGAEGTRPRRLDTPLQADQACAYPRAGSGRTTPPVRRYRYAPEVGGSLQMRTAPAVGLIVIALSAGAATADIVGVSGLELKSSPAEAIMDGPLDQSTISLDGHAHFDVLGSAQNNLIRAGYGRDDLRLTGLSWDLGATTFSDVPLHELRIAIFNSAGEGVSFAPFVGFEESGFGQATSAFYDLEDMGIAFDLAGEDLYIELFFDRAYAATSEGVYNEASFITLELTPTPAPGSLVGVGAAGLLAIRRRRR